VPSATSGARGRADATPVALEATAPIPSPVGEPLSPSPEQRRAACDAAQKRGDSATAAHHYDQATTAFGEALNSCSQALQGRVRGERGFAYLLGAHYDDARRELEAASTSSFDASLLAQIWFNRGLVEEAVGHPAEAELAFYRSNRLNPSKPAADKLAGRHVCPVTVARTRTPARAYAGWLDWWRALDEEVRRDPAQVNKQGYGPFARPEYPPKSEADARAVFCGTDCKDDGPFRADFGGFEYDTHVLERVDGKLWDFGVVGSGTHVLAQGAACGGGVDVSFGRAGRFFYARVTSFNPESKTRVQNVESSAGVVKACPNEDAPNARVECDDLCVSSTSTETYYLLDARDHTRLRTLSQRNDFPIALAPPPFDVKVTPGPSEFALNDDACAPVLYEAP
jgi:hypothetical protein